MEIKKEPQIPNDEVFTEIFIFFALYVCFLLAVSFLCLLVFTLMVGIVKAFA